MRPLPPPEPFPIDALGPGLGDAARAIADIVQAPIEMCAGAVLGSASLAVSAHIDVELPTGETKPVSLFLCPMAESGERKTTVDDYAFAAQQRCEQKLRVNRAAELEAYRVQPCRCGKRSRRRSPSNFRSPAKPVRRRTRRNWRSSAPNQRNRSSRC